MIGICTDSNSQLPQSLAERYAVEVVPVTVTVDDHDYLEGVDLDVDEFYEMLAVEPPPQVSTSQPSPGQFAAAYDALLHRGCDEIVSIHVTAATSGTLNAARLASRMSPIPVRLVDSGTAGFGVSCCVWAAGEAIAHGATIDRAVHVAESLSPRVGVVFVVGQSKFIRNGAEREGIPIMTVKNGQIEVISHVGTMRDAVEVMHDAATGWGPRLNVAVGLADRGGGALTEALVASLGQSTNVREVVRYRIGPSVGVYAGLGTVGCFMFPAE
ncbi:MAG: DegV family protein [Ilumatobacteraceae bacterium]